MGDGRNLLLAEDSGRAPAGGRGRKPGGRSGRVREGTRREEREGETEGGVERRVLQQQVAATQSRLVDSDSVGPQ